eukprot:gene43645-7357_t
MPLGTHAGSGKFQSIRQFFRALPAGEAPAGGEPAAAAAPAAPAAGGSGGGAAYVLDSRHRRTLVLDDAALLAGLTYPDDAKFVAEACKIMYDDLPPSRIIEYRFPDGKGEWMLSGMSQGACDMYRGQKFKQWMEMLEKPSCEAALRRLVEAGLVNRLFDDI